MNEFKLLVFDWDGTLMDSEARIVTCLERAARDIGAPVPARERLRDVIGLGMAEAVQHLYPQADPGFVRGFIDAYREHFLFRDNTPSTLFPGVREVLESLAAQGLLLAVATGKARRGLDRALEETGLEELFHATRCADETFSKPHPQMLQEIMTDLDTEAEATLMIGDTEYDMMMARNAGTRALAVSYGVHELDRLLSHDPVGHIDTITELPEWLAASTGPVSAA